MRWVSVARREPTHVPSVRSLLLLLLFFLFRFFLCSPTHMHTQRASGGGNETEKTGPLCWFVSCQLWPTNSKRKEDSSKGEEDQAGCQSVTSHRSGQLGYYNLGREW